MSANIPFDIQVEIIKRLLPVKSLVRFRSVSKQWKSLIDSSEFITHHTLNHTQPHHLLVRYKVGSDDKYVSILDDDSFPQHQFSPTVKLVSSESVVGCSHGLVCLRGSIGDRPNRTNLVVIWNPSIRKSVGIVLPHETIGVGVGFGVCPKTSDPKIVKITHSIPSADWQAEVFTLSSRAWRSIPINLRSLGKSIIFLLTQVVIDGVIHWATYDYSTKNNRIISFCLTSDEFGQVDLPDTLRHGRTVSLSKMDESLVVLSYYYMVDLDTQICDVWMMSTNGVSKSSFTKLYTVKVRLYGIVGFRKNGLLVMHRRDGELEVYEPDSKHTNGLGIYGHYFKTASYTESLILLNHSDSIIQ